MQRTTSSFLGLTLTIGLTLPHVATAQDVKIGGETVDISAADLSAADAVETMDPIYQIDAYIIDKTAPRNERGGWGKRGSNVFEIGEQIDAVVYLGNVGAHDAGIAANAYDLEVYINIRDDTGAVVTQIRPVHTFTSPPRLDTPIQDDYFQEYFTVSARVLEAGRYDVGFVFIDNTRPADKQVPLEVPLDVIFEDPEARDNFTDLVDLMQAPDVDMRYLLQRCAAVYHSRVELVGRGAIPAEVFAEYDDKLRYFVYADTIIEMGEKGISQDEAVTDTLDKMKEISFLYQSRMKRTIDAGYHPWESDVMILRDEEGCNVIYDMRETE